MQNYFLTTAEIDRLMNHDDIVAAYEAEAYHLGPVTYSENLRDAFICANCGVDTAEIKEYYSLHTKIWLFANHGLFRGMQCLNCVEMHLGRKLTHHDFTEAPINYRFPMSVKMFGLVIPNHRARIAASSSTTAIKSKERAKLRKRIDFIVANPDATIISE